MVNNQGATDTFREQNLFQREKKNYIAMVDK